MRGKKKKLLQKSKKRTTVKFKQTTVKYQRVAFPLACGGKVSLKVTYQGARSTPSIDKHWRARLAASPSPHNIHWQMKNKKRLKGTNMSEGDSTKRTFIMTGRKKRNEWPRVHAWVHSRWGEKEKTSKVVVFSFLVNEHISPGAEDGEVQGSREVAGGWKEAVATEELIWPASWLRLRRRSRSRCRWGRCWWTLRACRRCSGTSRCPSSLWGFRSLCTS